jgi:hypothetical protein
MPLCAEHPCAQLASCFADGSDSCPPHSAACCSVDLGLAAELGRPLLDSVGFFDSVTTAMAPTVLAALRDATGCTAYGTEEARFAYRCEFDQVLF